MGRVFEDIGWKVEGFNVGFGAGAEVIRVPWGADGPKVKIKVLSVANCGEVDKV